MKTILYGKSNLHDANLALFPMRIMPFEGEVAN
jgi:hypothetical protein